ncbi:RluA family pseudouridine synthase [Siccirubricoccus sp. KC 17139]|uniref:Pseudouridine synthase n=1 Tax=Siccirubricoccus soli TaxID=2899147 RepID=A0ABT1D814_9PROT|nr:RluA family pseudouridine synthase [Siccirubricoccus soli]MCO6418072.1 RluA family pseudouridine synthase [Siccirubricoccus soli]MCP2684207.1 RluA family pseudouridine synthase [Siccirubricoccus soli]
MTVQTLTIQESEADTRLDRWFRRRFPQLTQGALQKMLRSGQIRVDGKRVEANTRLQPGQAIRVPPLPEGPAPVPDRKPVSERDARELERMVIYQDDSVLVLDKPHGLAVQGGPGITRNLDAMLDALRFDAEERPRLVHRLDRDTSGVLLLARSAAAAAFLAKAFRGRDVEKTYWAVVVPQPEATEGRIDLALAKQGGPRGERTMAVDDPREGVRAITDFRTLDAARRRVAWLELKPLTGRTHQLRVHCAEGLGTPILGDGKYGGIAAHLEGLPGQLHLHARALRLPHPEGGVLEAAAPLPPHMRETFAYFGFEAPKTPKPRRLAAPGKR